MRLAAILISLALAAPPATAQLTDIQPGRNFPVKTDAFGTGRSENLDVGDVDNDGDYDVIVGNGGDGAPQLNVIFINEGGLQGGALGSFVDESATRFTGLPADKSRDIEFGDFENDGDLDILVSNRGTSINGGEVSRAYVNQGGLQIGTIGFFAEGTDAFWGTLVSIPLTDEDGVQDGQGPFRHYGRDSDFADFDNDGDLDLYFTTQGLNNAGNRDALIFLNDGSGRFDELWPWADAAADIRTHSFDTDLADFDGDYDIDIFASSRDSQARVYRNNLDGAATWSRDPFTDMTETALRDTGALAVDTFNMEAEYADVDGDGDFDLWMVNYDGNMERLLRNDGNFEFSKHASVIKGDPNVDEYEADFFDYDGDGDLDVFMANFLGENWIFQSGVAQGLTPAQGLFHRVGTTGGGSLAPWDEGPASGNGGSALDGEVADMDNDGDPDVLLGNDFNSNNHYWENALGIPDTHAPSVLQFTQQGDKSDGTPTPIQAQVRDNAAYYVIGYYDVRLIYSVDGGAEVCLKMFAQGGQQFRGVIPASVDGTVSYRVEVTDDAGNTSVSSTVVYDQTSSSNSPWVNLDCGTEGVYGVPYLQGAGTLAGLSTNTINLTDAAPNAAALLMLSVGSSPVPFKGGTLYTNPIVIQLLLLTDSGGQILFPLVWPSGVGPGAQIWWQYAIQDTTAQGNVSVSNAILSTTP